MLYQNYETEISQNNLSTVFAEVPEPLCLLGGWAVFLTVNKNFQKAQGGRDYHGSKDIDLGFHMADSISKNDIHNSVFLKAIKSLENNGFSLVSQRLVQHYHIDTKRGLTEEQSKRIPLHEMFDLYVDPIVDRIPSNAKSALGMIPIDEPLLLEVFENGKYQMIKAFGAKLMLPHPEVLLATKLNAVLYRQKDHKKTKDIADIYALIWHSGLKMSELRKRILKIKDEKTIADVISQFTEPDYEAAGNALGVDPKEITNVIKSFISTSDSNLMASEEVDMEKDDRWRIPFNIQYDAYVKILKALYQQKADSTPITLDRLTTVTQINKNTLGVNLAFLKSIHVVEGSAKSGYKLTTLGLDYVKAHVGEDAALIKLSSLSIIKQSHLDELAGFIELNIDVKPEKLFSFIKTEGRIADGPGFTGMTPPYGAGARVLLHIFQDAGLISDKTNEELGNLEKTVRSVKSTSLKTPAKSKKVKGISKDLGSSIKTPSSELNDGAFGRLMVSGVTTVDITDLDSLELTESALKILRKKVEAKMDDSMSDENSQIHTG